MARQLLTILSLSISLCSFGQESPDKSLAGLYRVNFAPTEQIKISIENNQPMLELVGQGKAPLSRVNENQYEIKVIKPTIGIQFVRDSSGKVLKLVWHWSPQKVEWLRTKDSPNDSPAGTSGLAALTGKFKLKNNSYRLMIIAAENDHLTFKVADHPVYPLTMLSQNFYSYQLNEYKNSFEFKMDKNGRAEKIITEETGPIEWIKEMDDENPVLARSFNNRQNSFTRADTLRGMLTPLRTCYDVSFYALDVKVDPEAKAIEGNTIIRFRVVQQFDKMQVDLYKNMAISKILYHDVQLSFTREYNAVFVQFPKSLTLGQEEEIRIYYAGKPQIPDPSSLRGGFLWMQDKNGKPWIESVCQGSGASLWWPCKDHLSDKPDSMKISITVPEGITEISNGKLLQKTKVEGNAVRFDWYVDYPINNYNVVLNIGDYVSFPEQYHRDNDSLPLNFYCLSYNTEKAKQIFNHAKLMLALYEKDFGKYPFQKDGFTLMEAPYPMEHQSAVSIGSINMPINSDKYDSAESIRTTWHEAAHEWWGNSITCKDMADLWIHEAFATYAEVLAYEQFVGKSAALKYLKDGVPANKEPIIGFYDVNDFHLGDMYTKGGLMLHTLRNVIDDDVVWFNMLRSLQDHFKYQTVTTADIVGYVNKITGKDFTYFFDQYLRYASIPQLQISFSQKGADLQLQYRWKADVKDFRMPVKVTTARNSYAFVYPTENWQSLSLPSMNEKDFKVDLDEFYVDVKKEVH
jgi:aminopeptidase N